MMDVFCFALKEAYGEQFVRIPNGILVEGLEEWLINNEAEASAAAAFSYVAQPYEEFDPSVASLRKKATIFIHTPIGSFPGAYARFPTMKTLLTGFVLYMYENCSYRVNDQFERVKQKYEALARINPSFAVDMIEQTLLLRALNPPNC